MPQTIHHIHDFHVHVHLLGSGRGDVILFVEFALWQQNNIDLSRRALDGWIPVFSKARYWDITSVLQGHYQKRGYLDTEFNDQYPFEKYHSK